MISGHGAGSLVSQWGNSIGRYKYTLSHVGTRPDMSFNVVRSQNNKTSNQMLLVIALPDIPVNNCQDLNSPMSTHV